jgi:RNA polymerase sigma-70 factor (ECF subfamily)
VAPTEGEITRLLAEIKAGNRNAAATLAELVYPDLKAIARYHMGRERPNHTLQPTALVNEAYLRLLQSHDVDARTRAHLLAAASVVMRRVLVDHARGRRAAKRFGGKQVELEDFLAAHNPNIDQLVLLNELLTQMAKFNPRGARVVELMYFGGLTEAEAADELGVSARTVRRDWDDAKTWLQAQLRRPPE